LKKRSIAIIIGLMGFALLGVVAMQLYFLRQSYDMQSKVFDRSVKEALENVVAKLNRHDADKFLNDQDRQRRLFARGVADISDILNASQKADPNERRIQLVDSSKIKNQPGRERQLARLRDSLQRMIVDQKLNEALSGSLSVQINYEEFIDPFGNVSYRYTPQVIKIPTNPNRKLHKYDTSRYFDPQLGNVISLNINPLWQAEQERKQKEKQISRIRQVLSSDSVARSQMGKAGVMESLVREYQRSGESLAKRLDPFWVDSLLRYELHNKGINLPFTYEVLHAKNDTLIYSNASGSADRPAFVTAETYQTPIFSKEVINDPGLIKLTFPQKSSLILSTMTATMATTAGLLFVLVLCFGYTLFAIIRQKKISEMKTDFINNMTHEFKTPVSTIMIASEALRDDEITEDKARVSRLANIIYEENERLGSHIERVLNIARIDKNDFKLESKPVDVNEMVNVVLDSMSLKLQKCNADVVLNLDAENAVINADELHFSNVLYNLIDNAIKYSEDIPHITISTYNKNGHVVINVADKGIGMGRDQQAKIFEQFYRIPTGNVHNVKGFGLGLSYVNTIVKRLNGSIAVKSEKDRGSEFELKFSAI
jgi:two-component system, OmpR family, phosphate regulon sensor histidine kinase PhoR